MIKRTDMPDVLSDRLALFLRNREVKNWVSSQETDNKLGFMNYFVISVVATLSPVIQIARDWIIQLPLQFNIY